MKGLTIAISGLPGSGSSTAAKIVADKLNLEYFSPGQLFKDISAGKYKDKSYSKTFLDLCKQRKLKLPKIKSKSTAEGTLALDLWQTDFGKSKEFHELIDELQVNLGEQGSYVIDGKLSLYILKSADLKIWLESSLEERATRSAFRDSLKKEKALQILKKREEAERQEWKKIYGIDYTEQEAYAHLVLEASFLSPEQISNQIIYYINNNLLNR